MIMERNTSLYHRNALGRLELRCPACREMLQPGDVENFQRCPFCDHLFPGDEKLEDFILDPIIRTWVGKSGATFGK